LPAVPASPAKPGMPSAVRPAANALVLHVQQDSWIELRRANSSAIVSRMAKAGTVETFDIDQPVTLIVGNLAGVEASLRGAPLALANGAKGNVPKLRIE
jgi:cytoskeleton protein RodZ